MYRPMPLICVAIASFLGLETSIVRAEHAKITLEVKSSLGEETAFVDQTPPPSGKNPRRVLKAKVGEPIKVQYMLTNVYPHKTLENVVVHFFVAKQDKAGQKDLPKLDNEENVVTESAFDMDFKPGSKAGQKTTIRVEKPGVYLIRVETSQTQSDHEHFSAIDLVVEAKTP